jgi:hypothetical protein
MEYSRLIHDYLDRELDATSEEALFSAISKNPEVRMEFNNQLQLHLVAQNDIGTITPPLESTNLIFSTLGFNIPSNNFNGAAAGIAEKSFLSKHGMTMLISIGTAILAGLAVYFYMQNNYAVNSNMAQSKDNFNGNTNERILSKQAPLVSSNSIESSNANTNLNSSSSVSKNSSLNIGKNDRNLSSNGENNANKNAKGFINNQKSFANNPQTTNDLASLNSDEENSNKSNFGGRSNLLAYSENANLNANPQQTRFLDEFRVNNNLSNNGMNNFSNNRLANQNIYSDFIKEVASILPKDYSFQIRSISAKSLDEVNIPSSGSLFNNLSLAFSYNIDEHNTIGIEVGQEQFSQRFSRIIDGQSFQYTQNPSLFWYGAKYTLNLPELAIFNSIVPYAQIFGGGTISGPLAKAQIGFNYNINSFISLNLAAEAGKLFYNVQNTYYSSDRIGFTYGINIHY